MGVKLDITNLPVNIKDLFFCYWNCMQCLQWLLWRREMALYCVDEPGVLWHDLHPSGFVSSEKPVGFQEWGILSQLSARLAITLYNQPTNKTQRPVPLGLSAPSSVEAEDSMWCGFVIASMIICEISCRCYKSVVWINVLRH